MTPRFVRRDTEGRFRENDFDPAPWAHYLALLDLARLPGDRPHIEAMMSAEFARQDPRRRV